MDISNFELELQVTGEKSIRGERETVLIAITPRQ
jgi:hypothetical protein